MRVRRDCSLMLIPAKNSEEAKSTTHDRQHVVVSTLIGVLRLVRECGSLDLETVGLLRRFQAVLRHRKRGLGRLRVPERFRCEPRRERRLKLASEASSVEVGERGMMLLSGVDPLNERSDVDLHLAVRERRNAVFRDPVRGRLAVPLRLHTGPLPRLVGRPCGRNGGEGEEHRGDQLQPPLGAGRLGHAIGCGRRARRGSGLTGRQHTARSGVGCLVHFGVDRMCNHRRRGAP